MHAFAWQDGQGRLQITNLARMEPRILKVLMLGWEFPPEISGGLGVACFGLTKALAAAGVEVSMVLPRNRSVSPNAHLRFLTPAKEADVGSSSPPSSGIRAIPVESALRPYDRPSSFADEPAARGIPTSATIDQAWSSPGADYNGDLFAEVTRYTDRVLAAAGHESFDVIHAHDWMTFPAGIELASRTGKPLVVHVHSTEFDRTAQRIDRRIYLIERDGLHQADAVVAVSHLTRTIIMANYGLEQKSIEVVYNGIELEDARRQAAPRLNQEREKVVLFLGRVTVQKGPEYFIRAARRVLDVMGNVRFIVAGAGDLIEKTIALSKKLGLDQKVLFTGFLRGQEVERVYKSADVFVMPSISEPFGLAALEAISNDVPVIVSRQSGVAEVLDHVLKVDFWNIDDLADRIVAVLRHEPLSDMLREHGSFEVQKLTWAESAHRCTKIYDRLGSS